MTGSKWEKRLKKLIQEELYGFELWGEGKSELSLKIALEMFIKSELKRQRGETLEAVKSWFPSGADLKYQNKSFLDFLDTLQKE